MMKPEKYLRGAFGAWEMLIDFPLPRLCAPGSAAGRMRLRSWSDFRWQGRPVGILLALAAVFCSVVFKPVAGSIIFAVLCTAFLDLKDSGRGLGLLTSCFLLKQHGVPMVDALPRMTGDWNAIGNPLAAVFVSLLEVAKAALLFTLAFYGAKLWILVILAGAFTVQGMLAADPDRESGVPLLPVPHENRRAGWWAFGILYLIMLPFFPFGVIAAGAVVYFCATGFAGYFRRNYGGVTSDFITPGRQPDPSCCCWLSVWFRACRRLPRW